MDLTYRTLFVSISIRTSW